MNSSCSLMKSVWKVWLVLPLCLVFSLFLVNNTFAEVKDVVCKTLVARAHTEGEWSPAVTVCAGKDDDGTAVLTSLGSQDDYFGRHANVRGIAAESKINVGDDDKRGVNFRRGDRDTVVKVGGLSFGQDEMGGKYNSLDYSDPEAFIDKVLSEGKGVIGKDRLVKTKKDVGGTTIIGNGLGCSVGEYSNNCNADEKQKYEGTVKRKGYQLSDCDWVQHYHNINTGEISYNLVCGASDEEVIYTIEILTEEETVAQESMNPTPAATQPTVDGEKEADCMGVALSGQGWILCPTLENAASTADGFSEMIDSMLAVKPELYDNNSGTYQAWDIFRNFANILLSIILLVIIFSQITGYGINNYGIKKMLPKFAVMVILINLSFVVCQLAVDISNILGSGLDDLFRGIASSINGGKTPTLFDTGNFISKLVAGFIAIVGGGGTVAGLIIPIATSVSGGPLVVFSLVLAALVALVSILMFFVMLGARMVIVIAFVAIAPLAFVCYILPNTQGLFKKWWSVLKAALIVYPICGALYGLSFVIKAIFIESAGADGVGVWEGAVLIIAPFLPFLALPGLLRGALNSIGTLGGALTSIGTGIRSGMSNARNSLMSSEAYKMQAEEGARLTQQRNAARGYERYKKRAAAAKTAGRPLSERQVRRGARYKETYDRLQREDRAARAIVAGEQYSDSTIGELSALWGNAFREGDVDELDALTSVMLNRFGTSGASTIGTTLAGMTGVGGSNEMQASLKRLQDMQNHDSTMNSLMRSKAPDAFQMISSAGVMDAHTDENGQRHVTYGDLGDFSRTQSIATSASDWASASKDALQRGVDSGNLDSDMIRQILNSEDPAIRSGLLSEKGKREVLEGALANQEQLGGQARVAVGEHGPQMPNEEMIRRSRNMTQEGATINIDHSGGHGGSNPAGNGPAPTGNQTA